MSGGGPKTGAGCLFWAVIAPLVIAPLGTCAVVGWSRLKSPHHTPLLNYAQTARPEAAAAVDPAVQRDGARICAAYHALAKTLPGDGMADQATVWKQLGLAAAPQDPWGRGYEWQPWNRTVRSYGKDRARGTPDDQVVRCDG